MTEGPLFGKIVWFILPVMLTNLLQIFYNAADMMVVSLSAEADAVGAIGTTSSLTSLIVNIFVGFSTGANVVVARHLGAQREREASEAVHTALLMSVLFGGVSSIIGLVLAPTVLQWMGVEGHLLELAVLYTRIYFAGVPFVSVTNYSGAILRAKGDASTPLRVLSCTGLANVVMNLAFVLLLGLSVEGVALATMLSNVFSAVWLVCCLAREEGVCRFSPRKLRLHGGRFLEILHIGLPTGIQTSLFSVSNILIQSSILQVDQLLAPAGSSFSPVVKGNAAAQNIAAFGHTTINAVAQAAITFTGQNIGAKRPERVRRVLGLCLAVGMSITLFIGLGVYLLREPLFSLYGVVEGAEGSPERVAFLAATIRTQIIMIPLFTCAFMEMSCGVAKGLGKAIGSTVITLIGTCILRVVWLLTVFRAHPSLEVIYICYPMTWTLTGAVQFLFVLIPLRKMIRKEKEKPIA